MEKPEKVIPELCRGFVLGEEEKEVTTRDCILYALGTAACQDPLDEADLRFCYEGHSDGFSVVPTFATTFISVAAVFEGLDKCPGLPSFNPMKLLHGEHRLTILSPLQPEMKIKSRAFITDVQDKRSGALLSVRVETACSGRPVCTNDFLLFIRGIGGFGGGAPASGGPSGGPQAPAGPPEKTVELTTQPNLALIYRLSGDYNPLHVDAGLAELGGFKRPILHGLCTLGIAVRVIVREVLKGDTSRVGSVSCRFTRETIPGDRLRVSLWGVGSPQLYFQVQNISNKGTVVLDRGVMELTPANNAKL